MQIYTRTGDKGKTKLIGGFEVDKDSVRVEAYGTVDELNSIVGMAASSSETTDSLKEELQIIQQYLFDCGNDLATVESEKYPYRADQKMVDWLESRIDEYSKIPPAVESFILPGGTFVASQLHFARTTARRAERRVVSFQKQEKTNPFVQKFLNRLSDYFFAAARVVNAEENVSDVLYERSGKVFHNEITKEDIPN